MKIPKRFIWIFTSSLIIGGIALVILLSYTANATAPKSLGIYYKVRKGDTVWEIARKYKVSRQSILQANRIRNPRRDVRTGLKLFIPGVRPINSKNGVWYKVRRGDTVWDVAKKHGISHRDVLNINRLSPSEIIFIGQKLFLPGVGSYGGFSSPLKSRLFVTSRYGYRRHPITRRRKFHHGLDLRAKTGTTVYAAKSGKVIFVGRYGGYGRLVIIKHDDGYTTRYGHLSRIKVNNGQKVKTNTVIGLSGNTGRSTGPHLHFEVRLKGQTIDPAKYLNRLKRV